MTENEQSTDARGFTHVADLEYERSAIKSETFCCDLSHLGYIRATGDDAENFLQTQLTNDLTQLTSNNFQLHGLCNPKGRLLCIFHISYTADGFLLQLPQSLVDDTVKYMSRYILRAKVKLIAGNDVRSFGVVGKSAAAKIKNSVGVLPESAGECSHTEDFSVLAHPGIEPRYQIIAKSDVSLALQNTISGDLPVVGSWVWALLNITNGIPTLYPETREAFVPQMANMDLIDGVNFEKGCYPGQEIVARMYYLGKVKQRMLLGHIDSGDAPNPGDAVYLKGQAQSVGSVVDAQPAPKSGYDLLAVIRLSGLDGGALHIGNPNGADIHLRDLPYPVVTDVSK